VRGVDSHACATRERESRRDSDGKKRGVLGCVVFAERGKKVAKNEKVS